MDRIFLYRKPNLPPWSPSHRDWHPGSRYVVSPPSSLTNILTCHRALSGLNLLIGSSLQLFPHVSSFYSCGTRSMLGIRSTLVPQWDLYNEGYLSSQHHSHRRQRHLCPGVQKRTGPLSYVFAIPCSISWLLKSSYNSFKIFAGA